LNFAAVLRAPTQDRSARAVISLWQTDNYGVLAKLFEAVDHA
jgi:hypothetical protein